jgi:hypothetical protein
VASRIDEKTSGNDLNKDAKQTEAILVEPYNSIGAGGDTTPRSVRLETSPTHQIYENIVSIHHSGFSLLHVV